MFCRNCGKEFKELAGKPDICANCGARALAHTAFCPQCGSPTDANAVVCVRCGASLESITTTANTDKAQDKTSKKSRLVLVLLSFILGLLGVHKFYSGKIVTGITMLMLTIIGVLTSILVDSGPGLILIAIVSVWVLIDLMKAIIGRVKDKEGKLITRWSN